MSVIQLRLLPTEVRVCVDYCCYKDMPLVGFSAVIESIALLVIVSLKKLSEEDKQGERGCWEKRQKYKFNLYFCLFCPQIPQMQFHTNEEIKPLFSLILFTKI